MSKEQLFTAERQQKISVILEKERKLVVRELCERFDVSAPTIRNDLRELEEKGVLVRTHGGAILSTVRDGDVMFRERNSINRESKESIGEEAMALVSDGDTIIIDSGTTTLAFAKKIAQKKNLRVITCDFQIAGYLEDNSEANVYFLGGMVKRGFFCTVGITVVRALAEMCADKCFLGTTGISADRGVTSADPQHSEIRREMIRVSRQTIVLSESRKIGVNSFSVTAPLEAIDILVTDDKLLPEEIERLEEAGIEIRIASRH